MVTKPDMADPEVRAGIMARARAVSDSAFKLGIVLDNLESLPADVQEWFPRFVEDGRGVANALRMEEASLRQHFIDDGRDGSSGQILDPLDARRRRAQSRGWKPSRHPELDEEFFRRVKVWPNGARLHLKRFNDNGDHETAWIEVSIEYAERGTVFKLHQLPGARDRRGSGSDSMVTADELLADRWEVD